VLLLLPVWSFAGTSGLLLGGCRRVPVLGLDLREVYRVVWDGRGSALIWWEREGGRVQVEHVGDENGPYNFYLWWQVTLKNLC
jgi:hypothetical protein